VRNIPWHPSVTQESETGLLLIITTSYDATVDFLVPLLPPGKVFRFNTDLFQQYEFWFDASGFTLTDPSGRSCSSQQIFKAYWRWPDWPVTRGAEERYVQAELRYLLSEMTNLLWADSKFVLVEPGAPRRAGKLLQLMRAAEFFNVPPFRASLNTRHSAGGEPEVVKSLSKRLPDGRFIFSTAVDPSRLAPSLPWFVQSYVEADFDMTVVVVRDHLFAFKLPRDFLDRSIDWRAITGLEECWQPIELSTSISGSILRYMKAMRLDFGRLDFLMGSDGEMYFCEVNPNPQYAWLDYDREYGLVLAVLEEISPVTPRHPIPLAHPLAEPRP